MRDRFRLSRLLGAVIALLALVAAPARADAPLNPHPANLVGTYDGRQMELAAALELGADGRFQYELAYGALDETATGTWRFDGSAVRLTSDPVDAPRFVLVSQAKGKSGMLRITLDLPQGLSRQYFDAQVTFTDGTVDRRQFAEDGLQLPLRRGQAVRSVVLTLGVFSLASEPMAVDTPAGAELHVRFEPRDLGKVAFADAPLRLADGALLLDRFDRTVRFRK